MDRWLVIAHAGFTFAMVGLMLAVQLAVYPAFRSVDPASFPAYAVEHSGSMVRSLALLAPIEVVLAAWLFLDTPAGVSRSLVFVSGALLAAGWIATAAWYAPLHGRLQQGYDAAMIEQLIRTNWARTVLWLGRGAFAAWFLAKMS